MTTFTIPEEIIGVPLFVPTIYDFFEIDSPGMPNGDDCLIVRGDLNNGYKAFIEAPVLAQNLFHTSDVVAGRQWSMSCWLQLENLVTPSTEGFMLGCSTQYTTLNSWADNKNTTLPFALVAYDVSGFRVWREPLNNVASPNHFKVNNFVSNTGFQGFQNYWFLFVITQQTTGVVGSGTTQTVSAYMDTYPNAIAADAEAGGSLPSGVYQSPRYLHLGAYHAGGVGRADSWKIGKWAFHDHALTHYERIEMWKAMMGASHSYLDDFNRATLGNNWLAMSAMSGITLTSNQIKWTTSSEKGMTWVRCLGSPNMYAQMDVIATGYRAFVTVRNQPYLTGANNYYCAGYSFMNNGWNIYQGSSTNIAYLASAAPTPPYNIRLESETDASGNVLLRLYHNGALKLSVTDSSAQKRLYDCNAGVLLMGGFGDAIGDNFQCGTLDAVNTFPPPLVPTGGYQNFKVPAGVSTLIVDAYGAQGGTDSSGITGGLGGRVKCNVTVVPGEILRVYVGQQAPQVQPAGFGGGGDRGSGIASLLGGSGGGATFIRRAPYAAADTLMAAPGGGGKGANNGGSGGAGGTPTGTAGGNSWGGVGGGGGGGTASAGGIAGTGGTLQTDGTQGQGGRGADASRSGGGGGGGWYGGGGAGGDGSAGGGGGGGSGLSTGVSETIQNGVRSGSGTISITW